MKKIEEKSLPQIDEQFALKLKFKNVEDLKEKLLASIKQQEEKRLEDGVRESISKVILERTVFKIPDTLIQHDGPIDGLNNI